MHVLLTGANGFVGRALAQRLVQAGELTGRPIERLTLLDLALDQPPAGSSVQPLCGDLADAAWLRAQLRLRPVDVVFHLASIPGGTAEQQYALAQAVNLGATTALLEAGRDQVLAGQGAPVFVFASSIAVFGAMPGQVDDDTLPVPAMSYGTHKLIGELLVADFSRHGWVDGRSLRLPGVLARPPAPTGQLSAFLSDIIRELGAGRPFTCSTSPGATTWAASLPCSLDNLLQAAAIAPARIGSRRAWTPPTLRFSMAELVDAIATVHGTPARDLVRYEPQPRIEALFGRLPPLHTPAAEALGFCSDGELTTLVRRALAVV